MKPSLTDQDYLDAAALLAVDVPAIKAVAEVESRGTGFLPDDRPVILFERHKFHAFTGGKFDGFAPDLSNRKAGRYGAAGANQHTRLERAMALDREAALRATSWGRFQLMGFNYRAAGFADLQSFINAMHDSERAQLMAFAHFVRTAGLDDELRAHRWASFAAGYNGKKYRANQYDTKLAAAYRKFGGK